MAGNASIPSDALGNLAVGAFGSTQAIVSGSRPSGVVIGGLNGSNVVTPLSFDSYGSLTVRPGVCPTWTASSVSTVSTTVSSGKSMMSIVNNSSTTWARIAGLYAMCPPQSNTTSGLLGIGSGTSYTQVIFGMYRITGHSGGTLLTKVAADPSDDSTLDASCTVRVGATVTGAATSPSYCWDAAYDGSKPVGPRPDICMKVWTLPPGGYGLTVTNINALSTAVGFLMTVTCAQNIA